VEVFLFITVILSAWCIYLTIQLRKTQQSFDALARVKSGSLSEVLRALVKAQTGTKKEFEDIYKQIARIDQEKTRHIQKVSLVRFNPFGKDDFEQSFVIALLDGVGSGVVLTNIHTNDRSHTYTKTIVRGRSEIELSTEEKKAIQLAMKV